MKKWIQNNKIPRQFLNNLLEVAMCMYVPDTHTHSPQAGKEQRRSA